MGKHTKVTLTTEVDELGRLMLVEEDPESLKSLMEMATLDIKKKDLIRADKLDKVQNLVVDEIAKRVETKPGEFSNKDLLDFHRTLQDTINKVTKEDPEVPSTIQINQQQVNINADSDGLSRDEKAKVAGIVQALLAQNGVSDNLANAIDVDFEDVT